MKEYADILRDADAIYIEELRAAGWYEKTSQAFAVFLPVKSVGVVATAAATNGSSRSAPSKPSTS